MKKIFLSLFLTALTALNSFAMPCIENFIPDSSGEYVYYRDYSFTRESYIGILYYDDTYIQIRYFAPMDLEQYLPEKNIELLISINPDSTALDMTGELFLTSIHPGAEDTDIVNYLHDILYEFTSRRLSAGIITPAAEGYISSNSLTKNGIYMRQEYPQFSGPVDIQYDALIPLYNIKNIFAPDGSKLMECVTFGQISSSDDRSFSDFSGFSTDKPVSPVNSKNKSKAKKITFENQSLTLYEDWDAPMENFWTYGDDAIITLSSIPELSEDKNLSENYILRKLLLSSAGSYVNFAQTNVIFDKKNNQIKIVSPNWQPDTENSVLNVKILTKPKKAVETSPAYYCFILSVFTEAYDKNKTYYENIIKSYQVK